MAIITALPGSRSWSIAADWSGGVKPVDNDSVVIPAGCSMLMDENTSGMANGIAGVTINGDATTPGMLYWKNGTSGHLLIKTGSFILGTTGTLKGRLLVNSNGTWGDTTGLGSAYTATISFCKTSSATATGINAQYLDIALYHYAPAVKYLTTYGTKFTVSAIDTGTNVLTTGTHGWPATRPVMVKSTGTLPAPLDATSVYYVVADTTTTVKLAYVSGGSIIAITSVGSGTIEIYDGHQSTSTTVMNVFEDATASTGWSSGCRVVLVDTNAPEAFDQQRGTVVVGGTTATLTFPSAANVDSVQYPGACIYLVQRNVAILSLCTSGHMVDSNSAQTAGGVFGCEINNLSGQLTNATTFNGSGINSGTGHIVSGSIAGCSSGIYSGTGHTVSGSIAGCNSGINSGTGHIVSGSIAGCSSGINYGTGHTVSGSIAGCSSGINSGTGHTASGSIAGCYSGIYSGTGHTVSGSIAGCNSGIYSGTGHTVSGSIGYTLAGVLRANTADFRFGTSDTNALSLILKSAKILTTPTFAARNTSGAGSKGGQGVFSEDHGRISGAHKAFLPMGDLTKMQCNGAGTGDLPPSADPEATTTGYCIGVSNVQTNCSIYANLTVFNKHRAFLAAGSHTATYKLQSTYTGTLTATDISLTAEYTGASNVRTTATSTSTVAKRIAGNDWSQTVTVSFTSAFDGWVDLSLDLTKYEAGKCLYVWPVPVIS